MIKNVGAIAKYLEQTLRNFTDLAIVGVSGGVDSSVVACLAVAALGKDNVHLLSMPFDQVDLQSFNARSKELADKLQAHHYVVSIGESTVQTEHALEKALVPGLAVLTRANIRPRLRMNLLYSFCGELGARTGKRTRVLGTGHLSEDLVGYDTKGGDALADIFLLSDLVKSEVYQLADYYGVPNSIIQAEPSAGLYPGQTDKDELGFDYYELEPATLALFGLIKSGKSDAEITPDLAPFKGLERRHVEFVVSRFKQHSHKHRARFTVDVRKPEWFG